MKKVIIFLSFTFICCFSIMNMYEAKSFIEETNRNYLFNFPVADIGVLRKFLVKITDEKGNLYFDVAPLVIYQSGQDDYVEEKFNLDFATLENISKVIYFGTKNKEVTDDIYFATQKLIYECFDDVYLSYGAYDYETAEAAITEIKNNIENNTTFSLTDFTTNENIYEITDRYIIDNFIVRGDNVNVSYKDEKIIIDFLDDLPFYQLHFIPKNDCQDVKIWKSNEMAILNMSSVCEKEYVISVDYINESQAEEDIEKNDTQDKEVSNEEIIEVKVPNTSKYNFEFVIILIIIGNIYYVFKK